MGRIRPSRDPVGDPAEAEPADAGVHDETARRLGLIAGRAVLLLALLAAAALGACGGEGGGEGGGEPERELAVAWVDPDGELPVVGSLAVDPGDGVVWMSTNTGLFRVAQGGAPQRVAGRLATPGGTGEVSEQLVVAFDGPGTLLASGHPAAEETVLPPALGLIRSEDAGRTWTSVSELGTADFHAIRRSGDLLVGALYGQSQVLASRDDGRTWEDRAAPRVLVDLALHPADPRRWVATAPDGVWLSGDEGGSWRPVDPTPNSYLAWPAPDALYRLDPGGPLMFSRDGGRRWEERGSTGGEPRAIAAAGADVLYAALLDGTVKRSRDSGRTWDALVSPSAPG